MRPGIEPTSSWILVRFLTCWAATETLGGPFNYSLTTAKQVREPGMEKGTKDAGARGGPHPCPILLWEHREPPPLPQAQSSSPQVLLPESALKPQNGPGHPASGQEAPLHLPPPLPLLLLPLSLCLSTASLPPSFTQRHRHFSPPFTKGPCGSIILTVPRF